MIEKGRKKRSEGKREGGRTGGKRRFKLLMN
jgi:hypothetical protein